MSRLLRLPLTFFAVLAALFFLPGVAFGDPLAPTTEECAADPSLPGCLPAGGGDVVEESGPLDEVADPPGAETSPPPADEQTQPQDTQSQSDGPPAGPVARTAGTSPQLAVEVPELPAAPLSVCDEFPDLPICAGTDPPDAPLTCEGLAELLGLPAGCPDSFSCEDLAELLGITCPEGPPTCETLAELFGLQGCPEPPTSCQEFADLLGIDNCSGIPCLDTSQLPAEAREGLAPLLDGLEAIGIKECPPKPATGGGGGTGGSNTPPLGASQPPPTEVHYANCDDARAKGAAPVYAGQPGYRAGLDSDNDGIGCEDETQYAATSSPQPTGKLAYTGYELESQLTIAWTLLMAGSAALILGRRRA
jgi:hypothetical protein